MQVLTCTVRRQELNVSTPSLVALSYDYINVTANFSTEWDDITQKWFHCRSVSNPSLRGDVLFDENNSIGEDEGLNLTSGDWEIWIHGSTYEGDTLVKRITTNVKVIHVSATGDDDSVLPDVVGPSVAEQAVAAMLQAEDYAEDAEDSAEDAEAWAVGTKDGTPVESGDAQYNNHSKYWAGVSADEATTAQALANAAQGYSKDSEAWAKGTRGGTPVTSGQDGYHDNAKYYADQAEGYKDDAAGYASDAYNSEVAAEGYADDASGYANDASGYADDAEDFAQESEAWAIGKIDGVDVPSTADQYHNNSKYWSDQANGYITGAIDNTLSTTGKAADAKVTGDRIKDVEFLANFADLNQFDKTTCYTLPNSFLNHTTTVDRIRHYTTGGYKVLFVPVTGSGVYAVTKNKETTVFRVGYGLVSPSDVDVSSAGDYNITYIDENSNNDDVVTLEIPALPEGETQWYIYLHCVANNDQIMTSYEPIYNTLYVGLHPYYNLKSLESNVGDMASDISDIEGDITNIGLDIDAIESNIGAISNGLIVKESPFHPTILFRKAQSATGLAEYDTRCCLPWPIAGTGTVTVALSESFASKYKIRTGYKASESSSITWYHSFANVNQTRAIQGYGFLLNIAKANTDDFIYANEISEIEEGITITVNGIAFYRKSETDSALFNQMKSTYYGKKLSILGDSISTYTGWIPEGYGNAHYPVSDVNTVNKTWWKKIANALGMDVLISDSKGGTRVSIFGGDTDYAGCTDERVSKLAVTRGEATVNPDVIIIYMGINDFNYGNSSLDPPVYATPLGDYDGTTAIPTGSSELEAFCKTFSGAYAVMLSKICTAYPLAEIWVCTLPQVEYTDPEVFPEINREGVPLTAFNDRIKVLASAFGVKVLDHACSGIRYFNLSTYSQTGTHWNNAGMSVLANNDIWQMDNSVRTRY